MSYVIQHTESRASGFQGQEPKMNIPQELKNQIPNHLDLEKSEVTTFGCVSSVDYFVGDVDDNAVVVIAPGWSADDGNAKMEYPGAESGDEAAQNYVDEGGWNDVDKTIWINVRTWRTGYVLDSNGDLVEIEIESVAHKVELDPDEPACEGDSDHDWRSPHEVVGGIQENPGVWGNAGGVIMTTVCRNCGAYMVTDTWAQDPQDGTQGLTSIKYNEADDDSLRWVEQKDSEERERT